MSVKSYGFAVGNLRARENSLLKQNDLISLLSSRNVFELGNSMRDKGIGEGVNQSDPLLLIKQHTAALWRYLTDIAPDMNAFAPFIYENDFHNLKAILKSVSKNRDFENLLIVPSLIEVSLIEKAIKEKRFDILPSFMSGCAKEAYEILTQTGDAQLADGVIDAALMTAQLEKAKESKVQIVEQLIKIKVFYSNIKVALRGAKSRKTAEFFDKTLVETGFLPVKELKNAALSGEEKVLEKLSRITEVSGAKAAEYYKEAPWKLEKFCDDLLMSKARFCKSVTMGIEPLIGYMYARITEIQNLRIIYSGVKTGQDTVKTEERLRELYG